MDEAKAKKVLGDYIQTDGVLHNLSHYTAWAPGDSTICLDDYFTIKELEAIIWWMKNHKT